MGGSSMEMLEQLIRHARNLNVFTGAGISTLSNIPDFRGPEGLYSKNYDGIDVETILSSSFFYSHPDIFYKWCKDVWYNLDDYRPNIVHTVLASLQKQGFVKNIYTQNIDMLHQRAGSPRVYEVHGSPAESYCIKCCKRFAYDEIAPVVRSGAVPRCDECGGLIKPKIVLYGEALDSNVLMNAEKDFSESDAVLVLGSSLTVQPAATLPLLALQNGGKVVIVNGSSTYLDREAYLHFDNLKTVFKRLDFAFNSGGDLL